MIASRNGNPNRIALVRAVCRLVGVAWLLGGCTPAAARVGSYDEAAIARAARNGEAAREALLRSDRLMRAWLEHADPVSGLLPRNLMADNDIWNARDAAADLYPFLVLTAWFTDRELFEGRMHDILLTETALTSRVGRLADTYSFAKQGFAREEIDFAEVQFGSAEYMKDGLLPIVEWLGTGPWLSRMRGLLDDSWHYASIETPYGKLPSDNVEVSGDQLQVLNRMYWATGEERYLDWAQRLADFYLLGGNHPTRDFERLRLRDHGNEIVSGLVELYATLTHARPARAAEYRPHVHAMLDRILEVGRNDDGLFYNVVDPRTGVPENAGTGDNFGYILNGFYTVYLLDGREAYRAAVLRALAALEPDYRGFDWESGSADGDADAVEGAINLVNREPHAAAEAWIDYQIRWMWGKQDSAHRANAQQFRGSGIVEGWHGDGNFSRTSLMYALWKSQGTSAHPWRSDLRLGAIRADGALLLSVAADEAWSGTIRFDEPRHRTRMKMPMDWPRMNQFPEWFVVEEAAMYVVEDAARGEREEYSGADLIEGIELRLGPGEELRLIVRRSGRGRS
jgi:hypothetical protein